MFSMYVLVFLTKSIQAVVDLEFLEEPPFPLLLFESCLYLRYCFVCKHTPFFIVGFASAKIQINCMRTGKIFLNEVVLLAPPSRVRLAIILASGFSIVL